MGATGLIAALALAGLLVWLFRPRRRVLAPEDDVQSPIDHDELAAAERELADDPGARAARDGVDEEEDDWGPGAP